MTPAASTGTAGVTSAVTSVLSSTMPTATAGAVALDDPSVRSSDVSGRRPAAGRSLCVSAMAGLCSNSPRSGWLAAAATVTACSDAPAGPYALPLHVRHPRRGRRLLRAAAIAGGARAARHPARPAYEHDRVDLDPHRVPAERLGGNAHP